jgi:DMSO reductase anchor subunit
MHPAYSVILFTTASGAGYGLVIWLALFGVLGLLPVSWKVMTFGLALALALIGLGLLSSTAHLGRPERAWRAFSQWQTSWLSREGVAAIFTFLPVGLLGLVWLMEGKVHSVAWIAALSALATVYCTGMIYQSLPTIRAWAEPLTTPVYLALALATGGVLLNLLLGVFARPTRLSLLLAIVALALGWVLKATYWSRIDSAARSTTAGTATGLGRFGTVRPLEPPHTQANFVMREMGYAVARSHAAKLRGMVVALLFVIPLLVLIGVLIADGRVTALPLLVATVSAGIGVAVERWLFFAEAEHKVMTFYGRAAA